MFILGLVLFFGVHFILLLGGPRDAVVERVGEGPFKGIFSLLAIAGFSLIYLGWPGAAQWNIYFYEPPLWLKQLNLVISFVAVVYVSAAYVPNNFRRRTKNPMLSGVKLWALGHIFANGDLRSLIVFVLFSVYASAVVMVRRGTWKQPKQVPGYWNFIWLGSALVLYSIIIHVHPFLAGIAVLPYFRAF